MRFVPSALTTHSSRVFRDSSRRVYAIFVPSGDHAGSSSARFRFAVWSLTSVFVQVGQLTRTKVEDAQDVAVGSGCFGNVRGQHHAGRCQIRWRDERVRHFDFRTSTTRSPSGAKSNASHCSSTGTSTPVSTKGPTSSPTSATRIAPAVVECHPASADGYRRGTRRRERMATPAIACAPLPSASHRPQRAPMVRRTDRPW